MPSACIVSAAWRRFDVTRLALRQRQRVCGELAARGLQATSLIVADDENLEIAREHGAETIEAPNDPLGRKCNLALRQAANHADWVVWVGSDDWIHPDAFDPLLGELPETPLIFHGARLAIVDLQSGRLQRIDSPSKYGAIPWLIDSRLLRPSRVTPGPIRPDLNRGLDGGLIRGLRRMRAPLEFVLHNPHDFRCIDFKSSVNLSTYEGAAAKRGVGGPEVAWDALAGWYPQDLIDQARDTSEAMRADREPDCAS